MPAGPPITARVPPGDDVYNEALLWYWGLDGHPVNDDEAGSAFERAALLGHPAAQFQMGVFYKCGGLRERDADRAREWFATVEEHVPWFIARAVSGNALGQWQLSRLIAHGVVSRDGDDFLEWCTAAAEQGYALAQFDLSQCYEYGEGTPRDYSKAVFWCKRAAAQGMVEAVYYYGNYLCSGGVSGGGLSGKKTVAETMAEAAQCLRVAANRGHPEAQHALAHLYMKSSPLDRRRACRWYKNARDNGVPALRNEGCAACLMLAACSGGMSTKVRISLAPSYFQSHMTLTSRPVPTTAVAASPPGPGAIPMLPGPLSAGPAAADDSPVPAAGAGLAPVPS
ncbi:Secretory immunoglobulin A-binding protein EsiB [Diplonema papillatum]|nr:Secretory immunoglobulin A-binding protein EsiB [Diplonema papillatum]